MSVVSVRSLMSWHPAKKESTFRRTSHPLGTYITTPLKELSMFMMVSSASNVVFLRSRITLPKDTSMSAPLNTGSSTMCLTELKVVSTDTNRYLSRS